MAFTFKLERPDGTPAEAPTMESTVTNVLDATGMRLGELEALAWGDPRRATGPLADLASGREDRPRPLGGPAARRL